MQSHFASPERAAPEELNAQVACVSSSGVVTGLLNTIGGVLAVLNTRRQVVALNDAFLRMVGVDEPECQLGMRLGELVECVHPSRNEGGCGTTEYCETCGAAIAIVTSLAERRSVERLCALRTQRGSTLVDHAFLVRAQPVEVEGDDYLLLFMQDVSQQERRAALERAFFHDVNNTLAALQISSEMLELTDPSELTGDMVMATRRLTAELQAQRRLADCTAGAYRPIWGEIRAGDLLSDLAKLYRNHPSSEGRTLELGDEHTELRLLTDAGLLPRVLCNMLTNAFEATEPGGSVRLWVEPVEAGTPPHVAVRFCVWNSGAIPAHVQRRIFQRHFSTKPGDGRGMGTWSMKLFGEEILGGQVDFESTPEEGTSFRIELPQGPGCSSALH